MINRLTRNPPCPTVSSSNQFFNSPPAPYATEWPPYTCVLTQTGNPTQLLTGFRPAHLRRQQGHDVPV